MCIQYGKIIDTSYRNTLFPFNILLYEIAYSTCKSPFGYIIMINGIIDSVYKDISAQSIVASARMVVFVHR